MQNQDKDQKTVLSRRAFVGKLATGAAGAAVVLAAGAGQAQAKQSLARAGTRSEGGERPFELRPPDGFDTMEARAPEAAVRLPEALPQDVPPPGALAPGTITPPSEPPPWDLLRPLALGSVVSHGWQLADLSGVVDGSCVLTLENERGRTHRVHVCGNDGRPQGLVYTKRFDLVVMNGGRGDLPTEEGLAQAVAEVARTLASNEAKWRNAPLVTALLPQTERVRQFGAAAQLR